MAHDVEAEIRRSAEIGLKGQRFFLLVDAAENPVNG